MNEPAFNVSQFINERRLGTLQLTVIALCVIVDLMDGFDLTAMSFVAPAFRAETHINPAVLGEVFSAAIFGGLVGQLICGPLADRFGRRYLTIALVTLFGIATLVTASVTGVAALIEVRLIAGFGLGAAHVLCRTLIVEYSPKRFAATMVQVAQTGYAIGGGAGVLAAWIVVSFGWRWVFYAGAIATFVLAVLLLLLLPESIRYLVLQLRDNAKVRGILQRIDPSLQLPAHATFVLDEEPSSATPVVPLFTEGRAFMTSMLWIMEFMNLMALFFTTQWMPTVMSAAGLPLRDAISVGTWTAIGSLIVGYGFSQLIDRRYRPYTFMAWAFLAGGLFYILMAHAGTNLPLVIAAALGIGFTVFGTQSAMNSLSYVIYPTFIRSTGAAWAVAVGRIGGILGPIIGGLLLAANFTPRTILEFAAIPSIFSAAAAFALVRHQGSTRTWQTSQTT